MNGKNEIPEYATFPRTFEKYRWYKPLLVLAVGVIVYFILIFVMVILFGAIYGTDATNALMGGSYESLNSEAGAYMSFLSVAIILPSLYVASRVVRDRPFSSYSSSRGGWDWKLYLKCQTIPLAIYVIYCVMYAMVHGKVSPTTFSLPYFLICLVIVPLQCVGEEYLMRGFVMQTVGSWSKIPILALIIQAVIFGVLHIYTILGVIGTVMCGLAYGFLALKTKGLEASSSMHIANNLSMTIMIGLGFGASTSTITMSNFIETIALLAVNTLALYYIGTRKEWF